MDSFGLSNLKLYVHYSMYANVKLCGATLVFWLEVAWPAVFDTGVLTKQKKFVSHRNLTIINSCILPGDLVM